jgi:hypothetical protein
MSVLMFTPESAVQTFLAKSNVIDCKIGDRALKKSNLAQNSSSSSPGCCQAIGD